MSVVAVEHLTKRYGEFAAVEDVSFAVAAGEIVAVLGPNGAGKTTTIESLEGFVEPTTGTVRVLDADPCRGGRAWRSRVGLVMQSTSLEGEATVRDLLALFGRLYPNARPVPEVLELIDLADDANARVGTLSGGQQRRVDLGLAIIGNPEILFLDEPTAGLDPEARRSCWATVDNLRQAGTTVLLTTHYLDEADHLADRVVILSAGRIVADTSPADLRARSGPTSVRFPLPAGAPIGDLPFRLAAHIDPADRLLAIRTTDVAAHLGELVAWAQRNDVDLSGLAVGPPSLEDAYLAIVGSAPSTQALSLSHV